VGHQEHSAPSARISEVDCKVKSNRQGAKSAKSTASRGLLLPDKFDCLGGLGVLGGSKVVTVAVLLGAFPSALEFGVFVAHNTG
jgi:hypothetical protein